MIRITKEADYAIILMGNLVNNCSEATYTSRGLAEQTRIPLPMVGKVLKRLVRSKLLVSHRGVKGGYGLARSPEAISVADIISVMDGPIGLTTCSVHAGDCEFEPTCPARSNWSRINQAVLSALKGISLLDMVRPRFNLNAAGTNESCLSPAIIGSPDKSERPLIKETL